jgi:hypothetical protein
MSEVGRYTGSSQTETVVFIPSHLTRGLVAGAISVCTGVYALYQFYQVTPEEVLAFIRPPK